MNVAVTRARRQCCIICDKWEKICISYKFGVHSAKNEEVQIVEMIALSAGISNAFVVLMGIGTVFVGLICIVILCLLIGLFCRLGDKKETAEQAPALNTQTSAPAANTATDLSPEKRREVIAAVSAALAEEMGTDISAIRIHSFKKI